MQYSVALPTDQVHQGAEFVSARAVAEMAMAIESAGFSACHVTDHPFPPADWVRGGGHHALDPLVTLSAVAASTTHLRLHTNVFVPAYRNPFIAAKAIATLDALSGGRVILGVAAGYLSAEFAALAGTFADRGAALDVALAAMKRAWTGEPVTAEGPGWSARGNVMLPVPASTPHPPIWVGGNSPAARRRAVTAGQGWSPFPASPALASAVRTAQLHNIEDLRAALAGLHAEAERHGRTEPLDICAVPFSHQHWRPRLNPPVLLAEAAELGDLGVTWLSVRLPAPDLATFLRHVARFGSDVIGASA
jgi:probable F420-dependent oxidoreductase